MSLPRLSPDYWLSTPISWSHETRKKTINSWNYSFQTSNPTHANGTTSRRRWSYTECRHPKHIRREHALWLLIQIVYITKPGRLHLKSIFTINLPDLGSTLEGLFVMFFHLHILILDPQASIGPFESTEGGIEDLRFWRLTCSRSFLRFAMY